MGRANSATLLIIADNLKKRLPGRFFHSRCVVQNRNVMNFECRFDARAGRFSKTGLSKPAPYVAGKIFRNLTLSQLVK
jgi:hypothetical protein